jgi:hypothetical protein
MIRSVTFRLCFHKKVKKEKECLVYRTEEKHGFIAIITK